MWTSQVKHPIPPIIEPVALDRCWLGMDGKCTAAFSPDRRLRFSLATETEVRADVGYTAAAHNLFLDWLSGLIRAYCEGRETLQIANGEQAAPDGICQAIK